MPLPTLGLLLILLQSAPSPPAPLRLTGHDVVVIANPKMEGSVALAEYYCERRGVPLEQIVQLELPTAEDISRADFNRLLRDPLRATLRGLRRQPKVLLTVYGVPLRVGPAPVTPADQQLSDAKKKERTEVQAKLQEVEAEFTAAERQHLLEPTPATMAKKDTLEKERSKLRNKRRELDDQLRMLAITQTGAAVDSELALLFWGDYPLPRWQPNMLNWQFPAAARTRAPETLFVARIDGPTPELCRRLIDDALAAEEVGLEGDAWIDSRGIQYKPQEDPSGTSYGGYDQSLRELHQLITRHTQVRSHIDVKEALFGIQQAKNCALYCGWYSHAKFVDCCVFRTGAVAVHIASSEAVSLRDPKARYWCKNLLENGACATMGPVAEPYLFAFPRPAEFFAFLLTGEYTLVECYFRTLSVNSWQMTLIGDPLYRPYAKAPQLQRIQIKASPEGAKPMFGGS